MLDLAAGGGRHTALLRDRGHRVVAADRDTAALGRRFGGDPAVEIVTVDLEDGRPWRLGGDFAGIVVTNYFHRPLFASIVEALALGGAVLYETFMLGNERFGRPSNPDFLVRPGELLAAFGGALTVVAFEQGIVDDPRPAAIQRIAAVKGPAGALPTRK
ncbi:MAG TPA: SAM-dependent methyltransferase [Stellaceae bacterium]|nr:SAM-dependent methyltransferase [Stellaceae bacterium]